MAQDTTSPQVLPPDITKMQQETAKQDAQRALQTGVTGENQAIQESIQPRYPAWPTSKPGPQSTPPPPGMKAINAIRREQVAEIGYNQETGEPGVARTPLATGQDLLGKRKERL